MDEVRTNGRKTVVKPEDAREIWGYISKRRGELQKSGMTGKDAWQEAAAEAWSIEGFDMSFKEFKSQLGRASRKFVNKKETVSPSFLETLKTSEPKEGRGVVRAEQAKTGKYIRRAVYKKSLEDDIEKELYNSLKGMLAGWEAVLEFGEVEAARVAKKVLDRVAKRLRWSSFSAEVFSSGGGVAPRYLKVKRLRGKRA